MDVRRLEEMVGEYVGESIAPSTARVYAVGQRRYLSFCRDSKLLPVPTSEHKLCLFVAHLASEGLQHSSIKGYLSAIRRLQIVQGLGDPFVASWPLLECELRGIKMKQAKKGASRPATRLLITPDMLRLLRKQWEKESHDPNCIMLWAACCTCFFCFLRSGEITVPSMAEYDADYHLSEGDVMLDSISKPTVVEVRIKASKTDPFRKGVSVFLGRTDRDLCPVGAMAAYLAVRGRDPGPFFRFRGGSP